MTAFFWVGAVATAVIVAMLFARRYPGRMGWLVGGVVIGLCAMLFWPVTLWVAVALWLTGFTRPNTGNSGHPCGPGERDGDNDGYCGEGR